MKTEKFSFENLLLLFVQLLENYGVLFIGTSQTLNYYICHKEALKNKVLEVLK